MCTRCASSRRSRQPHHPGRQSRCHRHAGGAHRFSLEPAGHRQHHAHADRAEGRSWQTPVWASWCSSGATATRCSPRCRRTIRPVPRGCHSIRAMAWWIRAARFTVSAIFSWPAVRYFRRAARLRQPDDPRAGDPRGRPRQGRTRKPARRGHAKGQERSATDRHSGLPFIGLTDFARSSVARRMPTCQVGYLETEFDTLRATACHIFVPRVLPSRRGFGCLKIKKNGLR